MRFLFYTHSLPLSFRLTLLWRGSLTPPLFPPPRAFHAGTWKGLVGMLSLPFGIPLTFAEERRRTRTRAEVEFRKHPPGNHKHLKHLGAFVTTRAEAIEPSARGHWITSEKCVLAILRQQFLSCGRWLAKRINNLREDWGIFELSGRIETRIWIEPRIWCVVSNLIVKKSHTAALQTAPGALYIVLRSAFTLFTSRSEITDGERGGPLVCSLAWLNRER